MIWQLHKKQEERIVIRDREPFMYLYLLIPESRSVCWDGKWERPYIFITKLILEKEKRTWEVKIQVGWVHEIKTIQETETTK